MAFAFRFSWISFAAMLVVVAIGVSLGQWQMGRANEKTQIEKRLVTREAALPLDVRAKPLPLEDVEFRRVVMRGEFVAGWPIYLDNRPHDGRAGFHLLMPFAVPGADRQVLVARGWLPRDPANRQALPTLETPSGTVEVHGVVRRSAGRLLQLGTAPALQPGAIIQNIDVDELSQASGIALQPFIVQQTNDTGDGLVRDWPRPSSGVDKHLGYAFQWYALAATAFIFYLVTGFRHGSK